MSNKIRIIAADDSALMRKRISEILNSQPDFEVVAAVRNGKEALEAACMLKPDVITLDVEMPVLDGITALGYIMSEVPTPCVMISAFTTEGAEETIRALEMGAVDFVTKPGGAISPDIGKVGEQIIAKVRLAAGVPVEKIRLIMAKKAGEEEKILRKPKAISRVFAIASSTGGTQALATILPAIRADLPAAVLITQHMPEGFTKSLAERLNWQSKITVIEAHNRMPIEPAKVIIARGGLHMEIGGDAGAPHVVLSSKPPQLGVRPSANIMMETAAKMFGEKTVGIVLTGMGSDGTLGAQAIKLAGGVILAEDKSSCVVYGMPKSVVEAGLADKVLPLGGIAEEMERMAAL
ncbi:MAG: chemotaxis response regulator protein-glutamate methylesterase [Candidatus Omnitrophota bacterium]